jgi:hypothetical protein
MSAIKAQLSSLGNHLAVAISEEEKLSKGCKASAARCRNALLELAKGCSAARKDVLEVGKSVPTKKRAPRDPKDEVKPDQVSSESDEKEAEPSQSGHPDQAAPVVAPAVAPVKKVRKPRTKKEIPASPAAP